MTGDWGGPFDIRAAIRAMMAKLEAGAVPVTLRLFVTPTEKAKGDDWCRERYGVGPDIEVVETRPLPLALRP